MGTKRFLILALLLAGCGGSDTDPNVGVGPQSMKCTPGAQVACACPGGGAGAQACNKEGTAYEECRCEAPMPDAGTDAPVLVKPSCVGSCQGNCYGTCDGTCTAMSSDGACIGTCTGVCTGACSVPCTQ